MQTFDQRDNIYFAKPGRLLYVSNADQDIIPEIEVVEVLAHPNIPTNFSNR